MKLLTGRVHWALLSSLALVAAGLVVAVLFVSRDRGSHAPAEARAESPIGNPAPPPATSTVSTPQAAALSIIVGDESKSLAFDQAGALPLRTGQGLRIEAKTERPAYLYVVWIDTQGIAQPVYPWKPGHWEILPTLETPTNSLRLPPDGGGSEWGYPVQGGAGMETLVFLARDTPLPRGVVVKDLFANLPPQSIPDGQLLVWLEGGARADNATRAPNFGGEKPLNSQADKLKHLLEQRLKPHFPLFRAVSLANSGS